MLKRAARGLPEAACWARLTRQHRRPDWSFLPAWSRIPAPQDCSWAEAPAGLPADLDSHVTTLRVSRWSPQTAPLYGLMRMKTQISSGRYAEAAGTLA